MKLTPKQENFCLYYIETSNASEAYRRAYAAEEMSEKTIQEAASRLLNNRKVIARLEQLRQSVTDKVKLELERVLQETMNIAFMDIRQFFSDKGSIKPTNQWTPEMAAAVASYEINEATGSRKIKFWDKNAALEKLMKHLGAYERDNQHKVNPLLALIKSVQGHAFPIAPANLIDAEFDEDEFD